MESADRWSPCSRIISASNCDRERDAQVDAVKRQFSLSSSRPSDGPFKTVHPEFGFAVTQGLSAPQHLEALSRYGLLVVSVNLWAL